MALKTKMQPRANDRANNAFLNRYGMSKSEWAQFKKTNKVEAHEKRMRVQNPH